MKKLIPAFMLALMLSLWGVGSALAEEDHCASGKAFGQHHAEMAQDGLLNGEMNPGMHEGFSTCLP